MICRINSRETNNSRKSLTTTEGNGIAKSGSLNTGAQSNKQRKTSSIRPSSTTGKPQTLTQGEISSGTQLLSPKIQIQSAAIVFGSGLEKYEGTEFHLRSEQISQKLRTPLTLKRKWQLKPQETTTSAIDKSIHISDSIEMEWKFVDKHEEEKKREKMKEIRKETEEIHQYIISSNMLAQFTPKSKNVIIIFANFPLASQEQANILLTDKKYLENWKKLNLQDKKIIRKVSEFKLSWI